jgi:hypothetical protein
MIMYMTLKPESVCVLSIHDNVYDPEARISLCVCVSVCLLSIHDNVYDPEARISLDKLASWINWRPGTVRRSQFVG